MPEPARTGLQLISHVVEAKPDELCAGAWEGFPGQVPVEHEAIGMGAFGMKIKETKAGPAQWDPQGFEQSYGRMEKPQGIFSCQGLCNPSPAPRAGHPSQEHLGT